MAKSIYWLTQDNEGIENGLGYSTHNKNMRKHTEKHIDINDPHAEWFLQIVPSDHYKPVEGKKNCLYTMFEFPEVPESYKFGLGHADIVLVPCKFCQDIFRPYTKKEPVIIWEGIDPKSFPFYQRKMPTKDKPFRILWSGARNTRKGYQYATGLANIVRDRPDMELYIKTHAKLPSKEQLFMELEEYNKTNGGRIDIERYMDVYLSTQEVRVLGEHKNIFFDMRKVPFDELRQMYYDAHLFLFPTTGEGWGLMGTEALATGLPVLATNVTGVRDWFDLQVGYDLAWEPVTICATNYGNMPVTTHSPIMTDVIKKVFHIKDNYKEALEKGKRGSKRMHSKFTWEMAGQRLASILRRL